MPSSLDSSVGSFVFVRHAEPVVERGSPPEEWELSHEGIGAIAHAAKNLRRLDLSGLVTSDEVKAQQTARLLGRLLAIEVRVDSRLHEVRRPWIEEDFHQEVVNYLNGQVTRDWESLDSVGARMETAIAEATAGAQVGIVAHGTAMAVVLGARGLVGSVSFWEQLTMPDAWLVETATLRRL
ncbi:MAG TPA: histidine phosphatase family protein [Acidimicrobiales bacterium]